MGGKLKFHLRNWETLTKDSEVLNLVKGLKIPLLHTVTPSNSHFALPSNKLAEEALDKEVFSMLEKKAIQVVRTPDQGRVFSHLFVTPKKDGGFRPIINLRKVNAVIPYQHFQMEGLKNVQDILLQGNWLIKIDLSDAFFSVPLHKDSRKLAAFHWKGVPYEFRVACFGLACAPRVFTKLMKVPIAFLRKLGLRVVVYLDDLLVMAASPRLALEARDTTMLVLESLGFTVNTKKSVLIPVQELTYLGILINSVNLTFSLPEEKVTSLLKSCQKISTLPISVRDLAKFVGKLISTMPAVTTALLQVRHLQRCLSGALHQQGSYEARAYLDKKCSTRGRLVVQEPPAEKRKASLYPPPRLDDSERCRRERGLGSKLRGLAHRGSVETRREGSPHKRVRDDCSKSGNQDLRKVEKPQVDSAPGRQHSDPVLHHETGGHQEQQAAAQGQ